MRSSAVAFGFSFSKFAAPRDAMRHGIGLVPEDRKKQALFLRLAARTNMTIAAHDRRTATGCHGGESAR